MYMHAACIFISCSRPVCFGAYRSKWSRNGYSRTRSLHCNVQTPLCTHAVRSAYIHIIEQMWTETFARDQRASDEWLQRCLNVAAGADGVMDRINTGKIDGSRSPFPTASIIYTRVRETMDNTYYNIHVSCKWFGRQPRSLPFGDIFG